MLMVPVVCYGLPKASTRSSGVEVVVVVGVVLVGLWSGGPAHPYVPRRVGSDREQGIG
jgi:hypothetical protein